MSRRERFLSLRGSHPHILPSILRCDFSDLRGEVAKLESAGVAGLHLDVMDGQRVPNLSFGIPVVAGFNRCTELPLDVHLMINTPEKYIEQFYEAGASAITFHIEAVADPLPVLEKIRDLGAAAGIAIDAQSDVAAIEHVAGHCDMVLVMSVQAGFGGQSFQTAALDKLVHAREIFGPDVFLEVDGGVNKETIADCVRSSADLLVVGSAITNHDDYGVAVSDLNDQVTAAGHQSS